MDVTEIWSLYHKGRDHHRSVDMYDKVSRCHSFYSGDQWHGLESGGEDLTKLNFIKSIGKYKISMIAQNKVAIVYSSSDGTVDDTCEALNEAASILWEQTKMDTLTWDVVKNAYITGDHYVYFSVDPQKGLSPNPFPKFRARMIDKTRVYFADETNPEINDQQWIIISERLPVERVKEVAAQNKVDPDLISPDSEDDDAPGEDAAREAAEKQGDRCTSLLYMRKVPGGLEFCRLTKTAVYSPAKVVPGLDVYPLCGMRWETKWGDARGWSGVELIIPNQIEVNKTAARRALSAKRYAYPKLAYNSQKIRNIDSIDSIGASIEIDNMESTPVRSVVDYITPASASSDAAALQNEMITQTRELEGAGDSAVGNVDPTKASGEAIKAARDQAAVPLNEQAAKYRQFIEDVALVWFKLIVVYYPDGITVSVVNGEPRQFHIDNASIRDFEVRVKVDVSPIDPYSKLASEVAVERLLQGGHITFEDYVELLDESSTVPKNKLQAIVDRKKQEAQMQAQMQAQAPQIPPLMGGANAG